LNKRVILKRIDEKVSDNHEAMDTGLDYDKYMKKVGANQELLDLRDFVVGISDDDVEDDELEDLPI
jgi:hypothetical protein